MDTAPWIILFSIASIPVIGFLVLLRLATRGREALQWERRAAFLAYGILAVLLVSLVLGRFVLD